MRPSHLFLGSPADNAQDCVSKGRNTRFRGERHPRAKLTEVQVLEIRRLGASKTLSVIQIADQYGIGRSTVTAICLKTRWAHI